MSYSPNSELLRRTIDLNYANKKRASSMKWIAINGLVLLVFAYDLWGKCAGYTSLLHYAELCVAGVAAANLLQHAAALARARRLARAAPAAAAARRPGPAADTSLADTDASAAEDMAAEALSLSLSMSAGRAWRSSPPPSPPSPHTSHSAGAPSSPASPLGRHERDEFIADRRSLANYLRSRADRGRAEGAEPGWGAPGPAAAASPVYQLAAVETDGGSPEERAEAGAGPAAWRRLQLDPQRLTQFNLNLRVWLHATVLVRVARELDALDAAFAAHGLSDVRMGQVSTERLRKLAGAFPALAPLLPFLEPFPDQQYVVQRYRELAAGGCLSAYKWNGGGAGWDEARPADAELLLHALAAYLDAQLPREASGAGGFSARHVSAAPAPPPRGPRALALHRAARAPPHFVLVHGEETVEVGAGRNNLLHCLLVFVALCGAREPPALRRLHLGPAGLNLLWVIGR